MRRKGPSAGPRGGKGEDVPRGEGIQKKTYDRECEEPQVRKTSACRQNNKGNAVDGHLRPGRGEREKTCFTGKGLKMMTGGKNAWGSFVKSGGSWFHEFRQPAFTRQKKKTLGKKKKTKKGARRVLKPCLFEG